MKKMGSREMGFILILLFCSTMASSSSLQLISPTATEISNYHQQTNTEKHGIGKDGVTNRIGRRYHARAITVSHGVGHGSAAGRGGGEGGGSRPHTGGGGGTAIIPIYAAGSARARSYQGRPRNAGTRHENNMGLLVAAVLAATAHMYRV